MNNGDDMAVIDRIIAETGERREALIPILQAIQAEYRYLPEDALRRVCAMTEITPADIEGVASFFPRFRRRPVGKHMIQVCVGTACHVKGAPAVYDAVAEHLAIPAGEDTDADGLFTVQKVACLGCCTLAPAVQIDSGTWGYVSPETVPRMLKAFLEQEARGGSAPSAARGDGDGTAEIRVGLGSCCVASGGENVFRALETSRSEIPAPIRVKRVSCLGMCYNEPLIEIRKPGQTPHFYAKVQPEDVRPILRKHFPPPGVFRRFKDRSEAWLEDLYTDRGRNAAEQRFLDQSAQPVTAFMAKQRRLATEHCGEIDPVDLDEYRRLGGLEALRRCLDDLSPEAIIAEIEKSGLRGRGGAGFPTGRKWRFVRGAEGETKYIICNGDEGDPGAFMDRMILESYPFRVIEGMIIAALAAGAAEGVLYIRTEYPLAVRRARAALEKLEAAGYLGENIGGTEHCLRVRAVEGAGAFVCGEETALIASLEGRRGMPSFRPPFPANRGLHGCPTLVNNTETLALVPWILRHGAEAFAALGTEKSRGTKVFSLAGKIRRGGLIEVPMGMTIREIVEEIGGGVAEDRAFKAVQVGGPSGGCIPARLGDTPVDYEALTEAGAMMGSGGFVVLDDSDCMVEIARYFLSFTQQESCGKCIPCRVGTRRMLDILERLCRGEAKAEEIGLLERLAHRVRAQSLCGLGKTAPNPVLTTLRYFRDEFDAHVEGRCPAGRCTALIKYTITDDCIGCVKCARQCPADAIAPRPYEKHEIDLEKCTRCDACRQVCPVDAVRVE
jgi:NADH-quinone oxidoreductase subunit F